MSSYKHTEPLASRKLQNMRKKIVLATKGTVLRLLLGKPKLGPDPVPDSLVAHLLLSNIPPSDSEAILVRNSIVNAREIYTRTLSHFDADTQGPSANTYSLDAVGRFISQHEGILSAIRRFPQEILQEIFLYFVDTDVTLKIDPRWSVTQVCGAWRVAALSVSSLWGQLPAIDLNDSKKSAKSQRSLLNEFLRRCRHTTPLNLCLSDQKLPGSYDRSSHPVLALLLTHCERWQRIRMSISAGTLLALRATKGRLPLLQTLSLSVDMLRTDDPTIQLANSLLDMFNVAPSLRQVSVRGIGGMGELSLPFAQLMEYETSSPAVSFDNYLQLRVLAITSGRQLTSVFQSFTSSSFSPRLTFEHLTKLILRVGTVLDEDLMLLHHVRLPSIREIIIESSYRQSTNLCCLLINIFTSMPEPCILTTLDVRIPHIRLGDLSALLSLTPALTELRARVSSSDIDSLGSIRHKQVLVPLLETCSFFVCRNDLDDRRVRTAVEHFAFWRCEKADGVNYNGVRRVTSLEVHDYNILRRSMAKLKESCLQQADFEPWHKKLSALELEQLEALRDALNKAIPYGFDARQKGKEWEDTPEIRKIESLLTEIEEYDINNPRSLIKSDLHTCIQNRFNIHSASPSLKETTSPVTEHARRIIEKWADSFEPILRDIHWVVRGRSSYGSEHYLKYMCLNHPIRSSPQDVVDLVMYGDEAGILGRSTTIRSEAERTGSSKSSLSWDGTWLS